MCVCVFVWVGLAGYAVIIYTVCVCVFFFQYVFGVEHILIFDWYYKIT
jgi:hypothetical protein